MAVERGQAGSPRGPVAHGVHPPEAADASGHGAARSRRRPTGWLRPARGGRRNAAGHPHRHRLGAPAGVRRGGPARSRRDPGTRRVACPAGSSSTLQDQAYRDSVLPPDVRKRVSVEAGVSMGWERWVGDEGAIIGLDHYGASAPAGTIFEEFGFTTDRVADIGRRVVREGLHGRHPDARGGAARRTAVMAAPHGAARLVGHRPHAGQRPGPRLSSDARRVRRRPRRCPAEGRAPPSARRRAGRRPRADRPRRRRLRPRRRLPGLRPAAGRGDHRQEGGSRDPHLRLRGGRVGRREQDARRSDRRVPRHVLGPPGRGARRHERADARRPGHRHRARGRVLPRVPGAPASAGSRATSGGWTRSWPSRQAAMGGGT